MTTKIEWTDETWNPIVAIGPNGERGWHCEKVSEGCKLCYAERRNKSGRCNMGTKLAYTPQSREQVKIEIHEPTLLKPLSWRKPRTVFVCSMTDLFGEFVPFEFIDRVFAVMALTPQHTYQVLTKRPERMAAYLNDLPHRVQAWDGGEGETEEALITWAHDSPDEHRNIQAACGDWLNTYNARNMGWPLPNVWLGTSVENQEQADERIPPLLRCPAAVRFLSVEPMLGPVDLGFCELDSLFSDRREDECSPVGCRECPSGHHWVNAMDFGVRSCGINWVIAGGESGPGARPMHPDWARSLRDQCVASGVPFFFKQWGAWQAGSAKHNNRVMLTDGTVYTGEQVRDGKIERRHLSGTGGWIPQLHPTAIARVGKAKAGRKLDGRTWDEMPSQMEAAR